MASLLERRQSVLGPCPTPLPQKDDDILQQDVSGRERTGTESGLLRQQNVANCKATDNLLRSQLLYRTAKGAQGLFQLNPSVSIHNKKDVFFARKKKQLSREVEQALLRGKAKLIERQGGPLPQVAAVNGQATAKSDINAGQPED